MQRIRSIIIRLILTLFLGAQLATLPQPVMAADWAGVASEADVAHDDAADGPDPATNAVRPVAIVPVVIKCSRFFTVIRDLRQVARLPATGATGPPA